MIIVDSTVWIAYLREDTTPQTVWLDANLTQQRIGLTDLILCEVLQGISTESQFAAVKRELLRFEVFPMGGIDLAIATARNYRILRRKGLTVRRTIDCLIATFCLQQGHRLLHDDRDFNPFEQHLGLQVLHPSP